MPYKLEQPPAKGADDHLTPQSTAIDAGALARWCTSTLSAYGQERVQPSIQQVEPSTISTAEPAYRSPVCISSAVHLRALRLPSDDIAAVFLDESVQPASAVQEALEIIQYAAHDVLTKLFCVSRPYILVVRMYSQTLCQCLRERANGFGSLYALCLASHAAIEAVWPLSFLESKWLRRYRLAVCTTDGFRGERCQVGHVVRYRTPML